METNNYEITNRPGDVYNPRIRSKINSRRASLGGERLSFEPQIIEHRLSSERKMPIQPQEHEEYIADSSVIITHDGDQSSSSTSYLQTESLDSSFVEVKNTLGKRSRSAKKVKIQEKTIAVDEKSYPVNKGQQAGLLRRVINRERPHLNAFCLKPPSRP
jgi:hypothetical protein